MLIVGCGVMKHRKHIHVSYKNEFNMKNPNHEHDKALKRLHH